MSDLRRTRLTLRLVRVVIAACALLLALTSAPAQEEVRRAEPIRRPETPRRQPSPAAPEPAQPFLETKPIPTPVPQTPPIEPAPPVSSGTAGEGEIRLTPGSGGPITPDALLESADALRQRGDHQNAIAFYDRLLRDYPAAVERQAALFGLGLSLRESGRGDEALRMFQQIVREFKVGDFVGPSAYRLGEAYAAGNNFTDALPMFRLAADRLADPRLRTAARFKQAEFAEQIARIPDARALYLQVGMEPEPNPFRDSALVAAARLARESGDQRDALRILTLLAETSKQPALKADASLRAGAIAQSMGQLADARKFLAQARTYDAEGTIAPTAKALEMQVLYELGKFAEVLELRKQGGPIEPGRDLQVALLVANSQRRLGSNEEAVRTYDEILSKYPTSPQAEEAGFQRIALLHAANASGLIEEIERHLASWPSGPNSAIVRFIHAQALDQAGRHAEAADLFSALLTSDLEEKYKPEAIFRAGFALDKAGRHADAVQTFAFFLQKYPRHEYVPKAALQRAVCLAKTGKTREAITDLDTIVKRFPKAPEHERALFQKAIYLGQLDDNAAMANAFKELLKFYPNSPEAARAHYWIGYTAFEAKDYRTAIPQLEEARKRDPETYNGRATQRLILSQYYLENSDATLAEIEKCKPTKGDPLVPPTVRRWLGITLLGKGDYARAERFLEEVLAAAPENKSDEAHYHLAKARQALGKHAAAIDSIQSYLTGLGDPTGRARALLLRGRSEIAMSSFEAALKTASEVSSLAPEGPLNAESLLLQGEIEMAMKNPLDAAKSFERVALIFDDPAITPRAMAAAVNALKAGGKETEAAEMLNKLRSRYPEFKP